MVDRSGELKDRIEAKKASLEAQLKQLKADARGAANNKVEQVEDELAKVRDMLKDGWESVSDATIKKLNAWLD